MLTNSEESWHQMLRNKFKKERRPLVFIPEIQQKKKTQNIGETIDTAGLGEGAASQGSLHPTNQSLNRKKTQNQTGETIDIAGLGEDAASQGSLHPTNQSLNRKKTQNQTGETIDIAGLGEGAERQGSHRMKMKAECKKRHPNVSFLTDKMARTRADRNIFLKSHSTMEALEEYPALRFPIILLAESQSQLDVDVDRSIMSGIGQIASRVIEQCQRRAIGLELFEMYEEAKAECAEESHRGLQVILATLLLPHLFREIPDALYVINKNPEVPTPVLVVKGNPFLEATYGVHLDYTEILTTQVHDITLAFSTLMSIYFVFNIEYHKKVKNTLNFIEKYLMSNSPQGKISPTVIKMANYLFF
ncbi:sterile alpha motif domain-containing protein 3-like isoform X2 [Engraulis encrasicolus]|uniref:sterile alpha motif domain-containing protein 3-like isoform X2 n=1 Tax=Engraulis encrasicolus TaxID=184585 RepID=UPI002FD2BB7A